MNEKCQIGKWGNSLALRIPAGMAAELGIREGEPVELKCENKLLIVRPTKRYQLADLLAGITPENQHAEVAAGTALGAEEW